MVRYLDPEHLLIDRDLETGDAIILCRIYLWSEISIEILLEFARLLREKNLPEFLGVFSSIRAPSVRIPHQTTEIAVVLRYTDSFMKYDVMRYCTSLFVRKFDLEVDYYVSDMSLNFNGIVYSDYPTFTDITLSIFDEENYHNTLATTRQRGHLNDIQIDLRSLHRYFTSDDWEQFCFGLFYFKSRLTFHNLSFLKPRSKFGNQDRNVAHYRVLPDALKIEFVTSDIPLEYKLKTLDEIYTWIHNFAMEVLLFHEEQALEISEDYDEGNLVNTVVGILREDTALQRNRVKRTYR